MRNRIGPVRAPILLQYAPKRRRFVIYIRGIEQGATGNGDCHAPLLLSTLEGLSLITDRRVPICVYWARVCKVIVFI